MKYVFWSHDPAGEFFYDHPIAEVEKVLKKEIAAGRKYHVLGIEATAVARPNRSRTEQAMNALVQRVRRAYDQVFQRFRQNLDKKGAEKQATQFVFSMARHWTKYRIDMATSGEVVLAAKHAMRYRLLESYDADEMPKISSSQVSTKALMEDALTLTPCFEKRDLTAAGNELFQSQCKRGDALFYRHERILQNLPQILDESKRALKVGGVRCMALLGGLHYSLAVLHKNQLPEIKSSHAVTPQIREILLKKDFFSFLARIHARASAGAQPRIVWAQRAVMTLALLRDLQHASPRNPTIAREFFEKRAKREEKAMRLVRRVTPSDFEEIAANYKYSEKPVYQVLEEHFSRKK